LTETPSVTTRLANAREPFSPFKSSRLNIKLEREFAFRSWNIGRVLTIWFGDFKNQKSLVKDRR
jgi:hypothetical protein